MVEMDNSLLLFNSHMWTSRIGESEWEGVGWEQNFYASTCIYSTVQYNTAFPRIYIDRLSISAAAIFELLELVPDCVRNLLRSFSISRKR